MATQVQFRRGTNSQHGSFTGANGEITVNTTNKSLHVHDGTTAGGFESAKANLSNVSLSGDATNSNAAVTLATVNSDVGTFGDGGAIPSITVNGKGLITGVTTSSLGNAATATTLQTARTINGVSFNGSGNITVEPYIEDDESTNATRYLVFTDNSTAGHKRLNEDSSLTYNPSTNTLSGGNFNSTSDINKKTNLREVVNSLEILKGIRGVKFNWKENNLPSVGVIAQEVEGVLPELVTETEGVKSVNYNGLVGVLIEAVKELQSEVEELKKTR